MMAHAVHEQENIPNAAALARATRAAAERGRLEG